MRRVAFMIDYAASDQCRNEDSYGVICVRCGQCGRRFEDGFLVHRPEGETVEGRPTAGGPEGTNEALAGAAAAMEREVRRRNRGRR